MRQLGRDIRARLLSRVSEGSLPGQFLSLAVSNAGVGAVSVAVLVVLARTVGTEELGQVVFAQATAQVIFAFLDPRLEDSLIRYVPMLARGPGGGTRATALFRRFLFLDQGLGTAFALIGITVVLSGALPLGDATEPAFLALAIAQMGARAAQGTASAGYALTDGLTRFGVVQGAAALATSVASVVGLLVADGGGYLAGAFVGTAVATAAMSVAALRRMRHGYGPPGSVEVAETPRMLNFTWKASLASSIAAGTDQLPLTVLGAVAGPQTLAIFRIAMAPARLIAALYSPVASVLYPVFSRDAAKDDIGSISRRASRFSRIGVPSAIAGSLIGWVILPPLIPLVFGSSFDGAGTAAVLLLTAALLRGSVAWSKVFPLALGRPDIRMAVLAAEGVLMVGGTALLGEEGAAAVAAVYLVTAALSTAIWLILLSRAALYAEPWSRSAA